MRITVSLSRTLSSFVEPELFVTEVARDPQGRAAAWASVPLPEAATRGRRHDAGDQQGCKEGAGTTHGTSTSLVNERTRPSLRATSR